jgi:hypothetical protein
MESSKKPKLPADPAAEPGMDRQDYNAPHAKYRLPAPHYEKIAVPDNF